MSIEGIAESYNRVATFMRNLESSDWFSGPNLTSVVAVPTEGEQAQSFKMTVNTSSPNDEANSAATNADAKNATPSNTKESGGK